MAEKVIVSEQGKVSLLEWVKSAGYAVVIAIATAIQKSLEQGNLTLDWKQLGMVALGAFVALVVGKAAAKPHVKTIYKTNSKAIEVAEDIKS